MQLLIGSRTILAVAAGYLFLAIATVPFLLPFFPLSVKGLLLFLIFAPPLYLFADWLGGKLGGSWGERTLPMKLAKAVLFIVGGLALVLVSAFISVVVRTAG